MIELEYKEKVLNKESTHIQIRTYLLEIGEEETLSAIGDLVIKDGDSVEILADSRYYPASKFNLTINDFIQKEETI
jgi:hypothetical protein